VDIQKDLDETIGDIPIIAEDFSRVILNLCNNAFDAMRDKMVNFNTNLETQYIASLPGVKSNSKSSNYSPKLSIRTKSENDRITIEIEDNGPGIPDEIKDKILQPFFTTKKGTEGTGLGLSITHDIVKAHGGELKVETKTARAGSDKEGEGSTFVIQIPLKNNEL
jgi:signal transduction histidine kinase